MQRLVRPFVLPRKAKVPSYRAHELRPHVFHVCLEASLVVHKTVVHLRCQKQGALFPFILASQTPTDTIATSM